MATCIENVGITPNRTKSPGQISSELISSALFENLGGLLGVDNNYRASTATLGASENYPSYAVRLSMAARHGSFYYFTPPYETEDGEWSFPLSGIEDELAEEIRRSATTLFHTQVFDWRPAGGSIAEQAPLLAICERGDGFVHFSHADGGHFALEQLAARAGIAIHHIPVDQRTLRVDVGALRTMLLQDRKIRAVILDQSFKLREQPISEIRAAIPDGVFVTYDCSHDGALIAGGQLGNPLLQGVDILHGNVHKTIAGPQRAFIGFKDPKHSLIKETCEWVAPRLQSNCHAGELSSMLIAFKELEAYGHEYAEQIVRNSQALAGQLAHLGFNVAGEGFGFTETHQVWVQLGARDYAISVVNKTLPEAGIRATCIQVPGANGAYGIRLGSQALTRRGLKEPHFEEIARLLFRVVIEKDCPFKIRAEVEDLMKCFPLFPLSYSFDNQCTAEAGKALISSIIA